MRIGLFFGSFNPIHIGHLIIGNQLAESGLVDEVWFVVSPQNPFKDSVTLLNDRQRLQMVRLALEHCNHLKASQVEFDLPKPSFTIDTIQYLEEKYPNHSFSILLGSDGFQNIDQWKNPDILKSKVEFIVYKRPGFEIKEIDGAIFKTLDAPLLNISSTFIRKSIQSGKSIQFLVPDVVKDYIEANLFYKSR